MSRDADLPFPIGETLYNGSTIDTNNLMGGEFIGRKYIVEDIDYASTNVGVKPKRSNRSRVIMAVRNDTGVAVLPKRIVTLKKGAGEFLGEVDGYADFLGEAHAYPADEFMPAAGAPNNDVFWVVLEGPAMTLTPSAWPATSPNDITIGDEICAQTAADSNVAANTLSGRACGRTSDYPTALTAHRVVVGKAMSAKTSGNTNADLLVEVIQH